MTPVEQLKFFGLNTVSLATNGSVQTYVMSDASGSKLQLSDHLRGLNDSKKKIANGRGESHK